jgi:CheY-like chemotaxis protein
LLCEDVPELRTLIIRVLRHHGFEVLPYASGEEAWEALESGLRPGLLITDVALSGFSGVELARRVDETYGIPILLVSGYVGQESLQPFAFLSKPFTTEQLLSAVGQLLEQPQPNEKEPACPTLEQAGPLSRD